VHCVCERWLCNSPDPFDDETEVCCRYCGLQGTVTAFVGRRRRELTTKEERAASGRHRSSRFRD
jgi:hypothetical protein